MTVKFGTPTEAELALINRMAKRPLSAEEVFSFSGKSAGDMMIPGRYTRISPELMNVMVDDARKGVSFMFNHNWHSFTGLQGVPYGKVYDGRIVAGTQEGETLEMHLSKYILRDDEVIDGMSANALIKKIEAGVMSDTSISFSTDVMKCSICGENYYSRKCRHWRGAPYEMGDGTQKVCTITAMPPSVILPQNNNALMEESIVFDGAYPGAVVSQSKGGDIIELPTGNFAVLGDKDELPEGTAFLNRYHNGDLLILAKKSEHKKPYALGGIPPKNEETPKGENKVNEKLKKVLESLSIEIVDDTMTDEAMEQLAVKWEELTAEKEALEALKTGEETPEIYLSKEQAKEALGADMKAEQVLALAKQGQEYHKKLVEDTIAMGVRAMGNDFKVETWTATLSAMEVTAINDIFENFAKQAGENIPAGRKTALAPEEQSKATGLPDEVFKF